jgi:hypothetical protein
MEEVGELAEALVIDQGLSHKPQGPDGVVGEAVDAIICLVDIICNTKPSITEAELEVIAACKLAKWTKISPLKGTQHG